MSTIFTKIIEGELPGHFVWQDDDCVAIMTINPITRGHALVIPRLEVDHWIDLPPELNAHLMEVSQTIASAQQRAFRPERIGLMVAGFEVPHVHVHVLPVNSMDDFSFARAAAHVEPAELAEAADAIKSELPQG